MISENGKAPATGRPAAVAVLLLFAVFPLAAQIPGPVSNTKNASAGLFGNDVDNFMNYFGFSGASFDNWFGYAGYQNTVGAGGGSRFSLGLARHLGGFYLGAWYNGNIIGLSSGSLHGKDASGAIDIDGGSQVELEDHRGDPSFLYAGNQIQFLFGFNRFALKLGFQEELEMKDFSGPGTEQDSTGKHYDESAAQGYFAGDIGAGLPIGIGDMTLKLNLDARVFFHLYSVENISEDSGTIARQGEHGDYIKPEFNLALNLDIPGDYGDVFTPGISYVFSAGFYNNKYNVNGITGNVKGTVRWEPDSIRMGNISVADIYVSENSPGVFGLRHVIIPQFNYSGNPFDRFEWGIFTRVPVLISCDSYNSYEEKTTVSSVPQTVTVQRLRPSTTDISNLVIIPELDLGVSFRAIPDRLTLNAGVIVAFKYYNYVKTVKPTGFSSAVTDGRDPVPVNERARNVSVNNSGWDFDSPLGARGFYPEL
jgi:hypothetical protein